MSDAIASQLVGLVEDLVDNVARKDDIERIESRVALLEGTVRNGLSERTKRTEEKVEGLGRQVEALSVEASASPVFAIERRQENAFSVRFSVSKKVAKGVLAGLVLLGGELLRRAWPDLAETLGRVVERLGGLL